MLPRDILSALDLDRHPRIVAAPKGEAPAGVIVSENPASAEPIAGVKLDDATSCEQTIAEASEAFGRWREVPAPMRGQVVRAIGDAFRERIEPLGALISLEVGKIRAEGIGEVQETIDIADFAVGLSRQLHGITMPSERPEHRMYEQWLPLGPIGVITAFNFPHAVWGWNAMLAAVCGDTVIWKPSLLAPLTALATHQIADRIATEMGHPGIFRLLIGTDEIVGERLVADRRLPLISATGSTRMGRRVGQVVAGRLGRSLLELGGNNGIIVTEQADLDLALKYIVFSAVGTAGQRCTTTRRLILHESIADKFLPRLINAYKTIRIGDPLAEGTLVGPLINARAVDTFLAAIDTARQQGGEVLFGGGRANGGKGAGGGHFVQPTIIRAPANGGGGGVGGGGGGGGGGGRLAISCEETFAPILYVFTYRDLEEAIAMHNGVDQGLSSAIFTTDLRQAERFLSPSGSGSDCGLAYVNLGTSGAEIGGAFGGEKDTGGGRESGSDSWKAYMRRQTCTINCGTSFTLAQGIRFES